jgi:nitrogen fixation NifU-like protein
VSDAFEEIYQEIIRDHYKHPRCRRSLPGAPIAENPSCGDKVSVIVKTDPAGVIVDAAFDGSGCSISMSSADILTGQLVGLTVTEARRRIDLFLSVLRGETASDALEGLGDAAAFKGVARLPVRVKCAALSWRAALDALSAADKTEGNSSAEKSPAKS